MPVRIPSQGMPGLQHPQLLGLLTNTGAPLAAKPRTFCTFFMKKSEKKNTEEDATGRCNWNTNYQEQDGAQNNFTEDVEGKE